MKIYRGFLVMRRFSVVMMVGIESMAIKDPNLGRWFTRL